MILRHFLLAVNDTNAYVVACPESREAVIIDPGEEDPQMETVIDEEGLHPRFVFVTHDHFDHTGGVEAAARRYGAEVLSAKGVICGIRGRAVGDGDRFRVGTLDLTVLETPGHTPDSISLAVGDVIFTGDALFAGSVGGTSSPAHFDEEIENIRRKILSHGQATRLFPGHGPPSTIAIEATFNPFL